MHKPIYAVLQKTNSTNVYMQQWIYRCYSPGLVMFASPLSWIAPSDEQGGWKGTDMKIFWAYGFLADLIGVVWMKPVLFLFEHAWLSVLICQQGVIKFIQINERTKWDSVQKSWHFSIFNRHIKFLITTEN